MDTLFLYPYRIGTKRGASVQTLDNEFFEAYKRLERLCSDIYDCRNGVSQYIEDMERASYRERFAISSWERAYKTLKHLRWVRNQIAHDSGQIQICEECDIHDVNAFYDDIMAGCDPLTQLRRYREDRAAVPKAVHRAEPATMPTASNCSGAVRPTHRHTGCLAVVLASALVLAAIVYVIVRLI